MTLLIIALGAIAIAALLGWTAVLILLSRSLLPMANAMRVWGELDHKFDQRVQGVLDRARANTVKPTIPTGRPEMQKQPIGMTAPMVFGPNTPPLISFMDEEQPDAGASGERLEATDA